MTSESVGAIFLGWLLGVLSPLIVDRIRNRYQEDEIRDGVYSELRELRFTLLVAAYGFQSEFGKLDRSYYQWLIANLETCDINAESAKMLEVVKNIAAKDDSTFALLVGEMRAKPGVGLNVRKYRMPYFDSKVGSLGIFDERKIAAMLDVRAQLEMFNEIVDDARMYHRMTYELAGINHQQAVKSANSCYVDLASRAREIVTQQSEI